VVPSEKFQQEHAVDVQTSKMERHIHFWGANEHLRALEIPQRVHIECVAWTASHGGMTANLKKNRPWLMKRYRQVVEELYDLRKVAHEESPNSHLDSEFLEILQAVLPPELHASLHSDVLFNELGADSLRSGRLVSRMRAIGVDISLAALYDYPLGHLSNLVQAARIGAAPTVRAAPINWESECKLPPTWPQTKNRQRERPAVLLTGATGFVGPLLVLELMKRREASSRPQGPIYCLVRGPNSEQRLDSSLKLCGSDLTTVSKNSRSKVCVVEGDLSQPQLGLEEGTYHELVDRVEEIVHNGAMVNHALPYSALRPSNVQGTLEVAKLASLAGASLTFVSSVAALPRGEMSPEDWLPPMSREQMDMLSGYGQTKAVAEQLLRQMTGLRVCVIRAGDIGPDRNTGYFNPKDTTLALVRACVLSGQAVRETSYVLGWLPANAAAHAIIQLGLTHGVYHIIGKSPTLRDVLRALELEGYRIQTVTSDVWSMALKSLSSAIGPALPFLESIEFPPLGTTVASLPTDMAINALGPDAVRAWEVLEEDLRPFVRRWRSDKFIPESLT
jgi:thioester reductase-like protein